MSLQVDRSSSRAKLPGMALLVLASLAGCANPGPPHPPSLHLPEVVSNLSAERVGDEVKLYWTTPQKTTDGITLTGPITAEICRATANSTCTMTKSMPVKSGPSEAVDPLPPTLRSDPQALISYRVNLLNNRQHSAGPSAPAFAAAGAAPPAMIGFHIEAAEQGALLQWKPEGGADVIELDRRHVVATAAKPSPQPGQTIQPTEKEPIEMRFRVAKAVVGGSPFRTDEGGSLDATARRGETYTYTAQRVRHVVLEGHALTIRSALSPAVTVVLRDTFPPRPPAGLEAIASGQGVSPAIDLSWRPDTDLDLAGYLVYRQELRADGSSGERQRLTPAPVVEPGFHDATVLSGHTYQYGVTAIDTSANESAPGATVKEEVRLP